MPNVIEVHVEGLDKLQKNLEALGRDVSQGILKKTLRKAGKFVATVLAAAAPRDTGFLSEHFDVKVRGTAKAKGAIAATAFIGPNGKAVHPPNPNAGTRAKRGGRKNPWPRTAAMIAKLLEWGTSKMAAEPFMASGFESSREQALDMITEDIAERIKEALEGKK